MVWLTILEEEIKVTLTGGVGGGEWVVISLKIENGPYEFLSFFRFLICLSDSYTENEKRLQIINSEFLVGNEARSCSCWLLYSSRHRNLR